MNIEALESFVLLSENKNFTRTAKMQYVVQSTISNRINELEKHVGKELLIRDNKNVSLTSAGKAFLPYAKRMLLLKKEGIIKARSIGFFEDRLALGTVDCIYKGVLSPITKDYFSRFPNIATKLKFNHSDEIMKLLIDEVLDIGIIYHQPKLSKFEVTPLFEDDIILVAGSNMKEPRNNHELHCEELTRLPLLYADLGEEFFAWLSEQLGDSPLIRLSVDHVSCVMDYVKAGYGYAFVPKTMVSKEISQNELMEINIRDSVPPSRKVYMVINKDRKDSLALKHWMELIHANLPFSPKIL